MWFTTNSLKLDVSPSPLSTWFYNDNTTLVFTVLRRGGRESLGMRSNPYLRRPSSVHLGWQWRINVYHTSLSLFSCTMNDPKRRKSLEMGLNPYIAAATAVISNNSLEVIGQRLSNFDIDYCMLCMCMFWWDKVCQLFIKFASICTFSKASNCLLNSFLLTVIVFWEMVMKQTVYQESVRGHHMQLHWPTSLCLCLVPRPHPDFISQSWRKIGRRPGIKTTSQMDSVSTNRVHVTYWPSPDFSPRLRDKIWEGPGDEATFVW